MTATQNHWQRVYDRREPQEMSWYEPAGEISLALIQEAQLPADAAIIDAGGGTSKLAGQLLEAGYTDITVADISPQALQRAQLELTDAERIHWVQADLRSHNFGRRYDLWHDRAVFHFMADPTDREHYLATLRTSLLPGGHLILATFGPDGPTRCSALHVTRYSTDQLAALLRPDFKLVSSHQTEHATPSGATQQFVYAHLRRYASDPNLGRT
jgi:SAM-dependent methyltransferase